MQSYYKNPKNYKFDSLYHVIFAYRDVMYNDEIHIRFQPPIEKHTITKESVPKDGIGRVIVEEFSYKHGTRVMECTFRIIDDHTVDLCLDMETNPFSFRIDIKMKKWFVRCGDQIREFNYW